MSIPERPAQAVIPANLLAWAKQRGVVDPEYQWRRFLDANGGTPPKERLDDRFIAWLRGAPTKKPEAAPPTEAPREPSIPAREWRAPSHWDEARRLADAGKVDNAAEAARILAALDKIPRDPDTLRHPGSVSTPPDDPSVDPDDEETAEREPKQEAK